MIAALFKILGWLVFVPACGMLHAFVLRYLWAWFVVPLGLPSIGMAHAYGISMLVGLMTPYRDNKKSEWSEVVALAILRPLLCLLFAWAVHAWWMP